MSLRIFVTATNTDIGKTYTSLQMIPILSALGYRVGVFKPIETGVIDSPSDGKVLFECAKAYNPALHELTLSTIVPIQFPLPAAPYVANAARAIDMKRIDSALSAIESRCDVIIIEGAGGLLVPIDKARMMIDLIAYFQAKTILVSHCGLGCINDMLLSMSMLESRHLPYEWILNCKPGNESFSTISAPYFLERFGIVKTTENDLLDVLKALL